MDRFANGFTITMQRENRSEMTGSKGHQQLLGDHHHHVKDENSMNVGDIEVLQLEESSIELPASEDNIEEEAEKDNTLTSTFVLKMSQSKPRGDKKASRTSFACDYPDCGKVFLSYHSLKAHDMAHSGVRPHACQWADCGRTFTSFYRMSAHCRTHTGQRPYSCPAPGCQKAFKSSSDLRRHSRVHTGDKPYACTFRGCFKSFSTLDIRKVHMRTHTGERPYVCDAANCNKSFSSRTNLSNHMRTHTGEKPFKCKHPDCGKSFTEYSTMHKHQMVHMQSVIACDICNRKYRSMSTYQTHRQREHGWTFDELQLQGTQTEESVEPAGGAGSRQRIQLLLTELDVRTLQIDGETAQVLVLPADGDQLQETGGSADIHLLGCTGAVVVEGDSGSPELVVSPVEMNVEEDPEPGEVDLSVDQGPGEVDLSVDQGPVEDQET